MTLALPIQDLISPSRSVNQDAAGCGTGLSACYCWQRTASATAGFCSSVRLEQREDELRLLRQALTSAYVQTAVELLEQQDRTDGLLKLFQAYQVTDDGDPATVPIRRMLSGWSRTLGPPLLHDDSIVAAAMAASP